VGSQAVDKDGKTPLDIAVQYGSKSAIKFFNTGEVLI
jgi:ankyrin repeat protein